MYMTKIKRKIALNVCRCINISNHQQFANQEAPRQEKIIQTSNSFHAPKNWPPRRIAKFSKEIQVQPSDDAQMNPHHLYLDTPKEFNLANCAYVGP